MADHGYDVADYRDVDPVFGNLADFDALRRRRPRAGHPGDHRHGAQPQLATEHAWFRAALAAGPGSPERARYLFRPTAAAPTERAAQQLAVDLRRPGVDPASPDGGSGTCTSSPPSSPTSNWRQPRGGRRLREHMRFWLDRGVDGFRIDVAHGMAKADGPARHGRRAEDAAARRPGRRRPASTRTACTRCTGGWRRCSTSTPGPDGRRRGLGRPRRRLAQYLRPDELHLAFNFAGCSRRLGRRRPARRSSTTPWPRSPPSARRPPGCCPTTTVPARHPLRRRRGRARAGRGRPRCCMLALPGSAYVYKGEELGLPEVARPARASRCRTRSGSARATPSAAATAAGCRCRGPATRRRTASARPARHLAAAARGLGRADRGGPGGDAGSTLTLYRDALRLRRTAIPRGEPFAWVEGLPDGVLAFRRGRFLCVVNVGDEPFTPPAGLVAGAELLLASDPTYAEPTRPQHPPRRHDRLVPHPLTPHPFS